MVVLFTNVVIKLNFCYLAVPEHEKNPPVINFIASFIWCHNYCIKLNTMPVLPKHHYNINDTRLTIRCF